MSNFNIRAATIVDAMAIASVRYQSWQETYRGIVGDSYLDKMSLVEGEERWKSILSQPSPNKFNVVVTNEREEVVGFVSGGRTRDNETKTEGEIYALYLLKKYHSLGLGKKLFLYGVNEMRKLGFQSFSVFVLSQNPTVHFYRKFKPDFEINEVVELGDEDYDEIGLAWNSMNIS
ncbi:MAG: GNAT family N-acetyltransferase [Bacteroidetes bacterium]|nr:GNAT family N-acetyltransferase [Bacteroidota bacterium]